MTEDRSEEEVLGQYLTAWLDALREGKSLELSDEASRELSEGQVHDLVAMARFIKAVNFPTERWQGRSDDIRARLEHQVVALRRRQLADGHARVVSADGFGECLRAARSNLEASIDGLSRDTGIPKALLEDVETSKRSPVRIPAEKMTELLQRLHMAFDETVELVRSSAERWALQTFPQGQTQLGRVGRDLSPKERREIQESSSTHDVDSDIKREMQRIDEYADVLRQRIQSVSPKS